MATKDKKAKAETLEDKLTDSSKAKEPFPVNYGTYVLNNPGDYKTFAKKLASKGLDVGFFGRLFGGYEVLADDKENYKVKVNTGRWSFYNRYDEAYEIDINKKTGAVSVTGVYAIKAPDNVLVKDKLRFAKALGKLAGYLKAADTPPTPADPAKKDTPADIDKIPEEHKNMFQQFYNALKQDIQSGNMAKLYQGLFLPMLAYQKQETGQPSTG